MNDNNGKRKAVESSDGRVFESVTAAARAIVFWRTGYERPADARYSDLDAVARRAWNDAGELERQIRTRITNVCRTGGKCSGLHWKFRPDLDSSFEAARAENQSKKMRERERARCGGIRNRIAALDDDFGLLRRSDDELLALYRALLK